MLFTYPVDSLACNWLNTSIIGTLVAGMDAIDGGGNPAAWPACLPEDKRLTLQRQSALRTKLEAVWTAYAALTQPQKLDVHTAIAQQTSIPDLFSDTALTCVCLDNLHANVRPAIASLAEYVFGKLSSLKEDGNVLRDIHFKVIQDSGVKVCPFCGLQNFQPAGLKRNALDHLMPISKYPFVSSDFRNLPPACHACNSLYKRDVDVLYDGHGNRRFCSDPYGGPTYAVRLTGSEFEAGNMSGGYQLPLWNVTIEGDPVHQANTWDAVYRIKPRYEATLDRDYIGWVRSFALWLVGEDPDARHMTPIHIAQELPRYINNVIQERFDDTAFLKAEAFRFLVSACDDAQMGNDAQEWLANFVYYAT